VEAVGKPKNQFDGIGFVLSESDPYVFIDLDHVVNDGVIEGWAREIVEKVDSYTGFSQSGTGIHIIARAKKPGPRCRTHKHPQFEIYGSVRLVVFTGGLVPGSQAEIMDAQRMVDEVHFGVFGENPRNAPPLAGDTARDRARCAARAHRRADSGERQEPAGDCGGCSRHCLPFAVRGMRQGVPPIPFRLSDRSRHGLERSAVSWRMPGLLGFWRTGTGCGSSPIRNRPSGRRSWRAGWSSTALRRLLRRNWFGISSLVRESRRRSRCRYRTRCTGRATGARGSATSSGRAWVSGMGHAACGWSGDALHRYAPIVLAAWLVRRYTLAKNGRRLHSSRG